MIEKEKKKNSIVVVLLKKERKRDRCKDEWGIGFVFWERERSADSTLVNRPFFSKKANKTRFGEVLFSFLF